MDSIGKNGKEAAEAIRSYVKPIFGFALNRVKQPGRGGGSGSGDYVAVVKILLRGAGH